MQNVVREKKVGGFSQHFYIEFQGLVYIILINDRLVKDLGKVLVTILFYFVEIVYFLILYWLLIKFDPTLFHFQLILSYFVMKIYIYIIILLLHKQNGIRRRLTLIFNKSRFG